MKKLLIIFAIIFALAICLVACGEGGESNSTTPTEKKTDASTEKPTEKPTEEPTEEPEETPTVGDGALDVPTEPTEKPTDEPTENPTEKPTEHVHEYGDWVVRKEATCTENGIKSKDCKCGDYILDLISATGHTPLDAVEENTVEPTGCTTKGSYDMVVYCDVCKAEISREKIEIDELGHTPGAEATCTTAQICTVCDIDLAPALGHTPGADATCTTSQNCIVCNYELVKPFGHTPGAEATCTTAQTCTACGAELAEVLGHNYEAVVTTPTCTEAGYTTYTCTRCDDTYIADETSALGHTPGAEAMCTTAQICTVCGVELASALGHTPGADATCTTSQNCIVCNYELVKPFGHTSGAEATCTTAQTCTVCNTVLVGIKGHAPGEAAGCITAQRCLDCGVVLEPARGHTPGEAATCTTAQICTACSTELASALGHTPGTEATCTTAQICTVCNTELVPAPGHSYRSVVTEPTCTETGFTTYTCSACGNKYVADETSALGHTPGTEATCTTSQVCTVCNEELVPAPGHSYRSVVTEPTCTETGFTTYTCTACGDKYIADETSALGHTPGAEATCTTAQICTVCNTELVPAPGHSYRSVVTEPTCTETGFTTYTCTACGDKYIADETSALGHTPGAEATCTTAQTCTVCNTVLVGIKGHAPGEAAGCITAQKCLDCGVVLEPARGHTPGEEATCTTAQICTACSTELASALGHTPGTEATCTTAQICTVCNEELVPAPGHSYRSVVTEPTCTETGFTTYTCTACGDKYIADETSALGHTPGAEATCTTAQTCTVCYATLVGALGHDYNEENTCTRCSNYKDEGVEFTYSSSTDSYSVTGYTGSAFEVIIPSTYKGKPVTSIGDYAFQLCSSLTSIEIPDSVTSIGDYAFGGCDSLTEVHISSIEAWCGISFGHSSDNPLSYAHNLYLNDELVTELVIPDSVTSVGNYAFYECSSLTSIEIPDSVTSIGNAAFYDCDGLTSIVIPDSVTSIGERAFSGCPIENATIPTLAISDIKQNNLKTVIITSGESIGSSAFAYCDNLTSIEIPDSVTSIGERAFSWCSSLTSVVFEGNSQLMSIGDYAFQLCSSLTSIEIPDNVTSISGSNPLSSAFSGCSRLVEVINKSSLNITAGSEDYGCVAYYAIEVHSGESKIVNYDDYLFYTYNEVNYLCGYVGADTELVLPEDYNGENYEIYKYAFDSNVTSVIIPDSVTNIGSSAFSSCDSLTSIKIPDSVTSIGFNAFYNCSSLTRIIIPDSVTSIGWYAFYGCSSLTIYCEAESQPEGWAEDWNSSDRPVVWGYKGEE